MASFGEILQSEVEGHSHEKDAQQSTGPVHVAALLLRTADHETCHSCLSPFTMSLNAMMDHFMTAGDTQTLVQDSADQVFKFQLFNKAKVDQVMMLNTAKVFRSTASRRPDSVSAQLSGSNS